MSAPDDNCLSIYLSASTNDGITTDDNRTIETIHKRVKERKIERAEESVSFTWAFVRRRRRQRRQWRTLP